MNMQIQFEAAETRQMLAQSAQKLAQAGLGADAFHAQLNALGFRGVMIPEEFGGFGGDMADLAAILEPFGHGLASDISLLNAAICGPLLAAAGQGDVLEGIVDGTRHVVLAVYEPLSGYGTVPVSTVMDSTVSGVKLAVSGDDKASDFIVPARLPDKRNAINDALIAELHSAVTRAQTEAKAAVLWGKGEHFSAGLDLAQLAQKMQEGGWRKRGTWHPTFDLIARSSVPFVAALQGACIGGGLELASATHIRVADKTTYFALPEATRGIFVGGGGGGAVRRQRLMGYARMSDMMLTGRVLNADAGQSFDKAVEIAERIAGNAPLVNWAVCACLPRVNDVSHEVGLFMESLIGAAIAGEDGRSRVRDFLDNKAGRVNPETS